MARIDRRGKTQPGIFIRMPRELREILQEVSKETGYTQRDIVIMALEDWFKIKAPGI